MYGSSDGLTVLMDVVTVRALSRTRGSDDELGEGHDSERAARRRVRLQSAAVSAAKGASASCGCVGIRVT